MAHKSRWLVEKRILLIEYIGDVDKTEIKQLNEELERYLSEGQAPIHIISDNSRMGKADLTVQLARDTFSAMKKPGWGWVVFIGLGRLIRFFAEIFATQFSVKIKLASDMDDAMNLLRKLDESLESKSS